MMVQIFLMLGIGLVTGIFSGLFGVGGGVILVPILVIFLKYSQVTAAATSLVALLLPVGLLGVLEYYKLGKLTPHDIKVGLIIAVGLFFGAYIGTRIAVQLPDFALRKYFAVFLIFIAARLWWF